MGRWPNLDNGDGGYTTVSAQPAGNRLTSGTALPAGNWIGGDDPSQGHPLVDDQP